MLRIAVQSKGRLYDETMELLTAAGIKPHRLAAFRNAFGIGFAVARGGGLINLPREVLVLFKISFNFGDNPFCRTALAGRRIDDKNMSHFRSLPIQKIFI